jgi:cleavage and polyadenylation specificity factor subunit 3
LDSRDLGDFAGLSTSVVTQRQSLHVEVSWELIKWHVDAMFGGVTSGLSMDKLPTLRVSLIGYFVQRALTIIRRL